MVITQVEWHFFIKYYLLCYAFGDIFDPIFVVADDSMEQNDIDVHKIPGLGVGTDIGSFAWVVLCKTRGCNKTFYKWLNQSVLIPAVLKLRKHNNLPESSVA